MTNVKTPRKHADVIRAYADGYEIQTNSSGEWRDLAYPCFAEEFEYRVKPEPKKHKYRVALLHGGTFTWTCSEDFREDGKLETSPHFVRYLTDWIEVEV